MLITISTPPSHTPPSSEYSDVDTDVLAFLVEAVTNTPYTDFVSLNIWSKINPDSDAYMLVTGSKDGNVWPAAGMCSTLRDLARWGVAWTPSWRGLGGERVVPEEAVGEVQAGGGGGGRGVGGWGFSGLGMDQKGVGSC